jgi:hypothetical protein
VATARGVKQSSPRVAGSDTQLAVVWEEDMGAGVGRDIRGRVFDAAEPDPGAQ